MLESILLGARDTLVKRPLPVEVADAQNGFCIQISVPLRAEAKLGAATRRRIVLRQVMDFDRKRSGLRNSVMHSFVSSRGSLCGWSEPLN